MSNTTRLSIVLATLLVQSFAFAQEPASPSPMPSMPPMPKPAPEHAWFKQLEGEWTWESENPKCSGTESARMIGGFWLLADGVGEMPGMKVETRTALSYDVHKKTYVGSVVTGMDSTLWIYTSGELDPTGKILTLHCEGPNVMTGDASKPVKYVESHEFKDADTRIFTSKMQNPDGTFLQILTATYKRKK